MAQKKYLDESGLSHLVSKIKTYVSGLIDGLATVYRKTADKIPVGDIKDLTASVTELNYVKGVTSAIQTQLNGKVAKVTGKDLSTNDYTTAEKNKLADIAEGANNYTLPTAGSSLGGVKTTSTVTSTSGLTPTPIINGVPYYKDTNTWNQLQGATASAAGTAGYVPQPASADRDKFLKGDGTWGTPQNTTYEDATTSQHGLLSTADKTKLDGIAEGANKTTVDTAMSSTSTNPVQNKVINSALSAKAALASPTFTGTPKAPTAAAGTNTTQIATTAFVKTSIDNALSGITGISFAKVDSYSALPATGTAGTIYLVPNTGASPNAYDEYVYIDATVKYEKIGTTDIDLSGYVQSTDLVAITESEIDALF